jgi:hypothetical protein
LTEINDLIKSVAAFDPTDLHARNHANKNSSISHVYLFLSSLILNNCEAIGLLLAEHSNNHLAFL